jgi:DNA polymerase-3 subunit gamma/tau
MIHSSNSYIPLARKYRPATFSELAGQDATATALANAIKLGREPHAVIFSGVRGIGKTTSARLYAKALNCDVAMSPEPCNQCESCLAITRGTHEDVMEIDGASNTSVDDVRALRETVAYVALRSRFKVYIIDEVHMLSQSAFNALLKTLEEPPAHVVFIFATTELQKIPQTIMSRCQLFHLQRLGLATIRERMIEILNSEKIPYEEKAVATIAREGHGSMRDALTLLDHVIAIGAGQVSIEALSKIVSHVSSTHFLTLLEALVQRQANTIIQTFDVLEESGIDMSDVAEKLAGLARHGFILRDVGANSIDFKALGFDDEEVRQLDAIGRKSGPADLNRIFRTMTKARIELDGSALDRYVLENFCLEWCFDPGIAFQFAAPQNRPNSAHLSASSSSIKPSTSSPLQTNPAAATQTNMATIKSQLSSPASVTVVPTQPPQKTLPATWRECVEIWKKLKPLQAKRLEDAHPIQYTTKIIELVVPTESYLSAMLLKPEEQKKLKDAFLDMFGFEGQIVVNPKKAGASAQPHLDAEPVLPDSVASIQKRENDKWRESLMREALNHPITQDTMKLFNATIESIETNS